jgi:hypothetical protein
MALVLVLMVTSLLLISGLTIWSSLRSDLSQAQVNIPRVQAEFLAKGALQLALLKARYCPTPLYDAVYYSVGKNPEYVHSSGYGHLSDGPVVPTPEIAQVLSGPAFLTGDVTINAGSGLVTSRSGVKNIPGAAGSTDTDDINGLDGLTNSDYTVDRYLNFFALDLADRTYTSPTLVQQPTGVFNGQANVSVSETFNCPIMNAMDPYSGSMRILGMTVLTSAGGQQYTTDSIQVVATASVATMLSGTVRNWSVQASTIYKVRRRY